jgi:hypothetical protein
MKYYRCYLFAADDHIARAEILKCTDDEDARRQCRELVAVNDRHAGAEVWHGARRVYRYPEEAEALARERRRRKGDASAQDAAIADALSVQIAADRRRRLQDEAVKVAQLREQRLEREAAAKLSLKGRGAAAN